MGTDEEEGAQCEHCFSPHDSVSFPLAEIKEILENENNIKEKNKYGCTLLHLVVQNNTESTADIFCFLLEKGATIARKNISECSVPLAVEMAESKCSIEKVRILLEKADVKDSTSPEMLQLLLGNEEDHFISLNGSNYAVELVRMLLENGANVEDEDDWGDTVLHFAVQNKNECAVDIVQLLLDRRSSANAKCSAEALCLAVQNESSGALKIVALLLNDEMDVDDKSYLDSTALQLAIQNKHKCAVDMVRLLIDKGSSIEETDVEGCNAFHVATKQCSNNALEIVRILWERGANVEEMNEIGLTPLHFAVCNEHQSAPHILRFLIEKGASNGIREYKWDDDDDPDVDYEADRTLLIHHASETASPYAMELVRILLEQGAEVDVLDVDGRTPFHHAVRNKHESSARLVQFLLDRGAALTIKDSRGKTPLHVAAQNQSDSAVEIVRTLLQQGTISAVNVNERDEDKSTALHFAVQNPGDCALALVQLLAENGARVEFQDRWGATPLHRAIETVSKHAVNIIIVLLGTQDARSALRMKDEQSKTPLHLACMGGVFNMPINSVANFAEDIVRVILAKFRAIANEKKKDLFHSFVIENVNEMGAGGMTPLHYAVQNERYSAPEIVRLLLENGARVGVQDQLGRTALHVAIETPTRTADRLVEMLLAHEADVKVKDKRGLTPVNCAERCDGYTDDICAMVRRLMLSTN